MISQGAFGLAAPTQPAPARRVRSPRRPAAFGTSGPRARWLEVRRHSRGLPCFREPDDAVQPVRPLWRDLPPERGQRSSCPGDTRRFSCSIFARTPPSTPVPDGTGLYSAPAVGGAGGARSMRVRLITFAPMRAASSGQIWAQRARPRPSSRPGILLGTDGWRPTRERPPTPKGPQARAFVSHAQCSWPRAHRTACPHPTARP